MKAKRFGNWGKRAWISILIIVLLIPATIFLCWKASGRMYYLASVLIIGYTMVPFFMVFEHRKPQARELVIIAVMCAIAVISRALFVMVDHFKPMTAIIMIAAIALGPEAGFMVGSVSAFASNFIYGQGPWTPWQMFAFGVAGFLFGILARGHILPQIKSWKSKLVVSIIGFVTVFALIGPLLDTSSLLTMSTEISKEYAIAIYTSGVPVNLIHATATFLTLFLFAKPLLEKLERVQLKYGMLED